MEKIRIKIEKTPRRKYPALREVAEPGRSLLICDKTGKRKSSSKQQLVRVNKDDIIICTLHYNNKDDIKIYKILELENSEYAYIEELNSFNSLWDELPPAYLDNAIIEAMILARGVKHA